MFDKRVIFITLCVIASVLAAARPSEFFDKWKKEHGFGSSGGSGHSMFGHSLFEDDADMDLELKDMRPLETIQGWVLGKDKKTGAKTKIYFEQIGHEKHDITVKDLKDVSIHCEGNFPVELAYEGDPNYKFHNVGTGTAMKQFKNETHDMEVERHTMYAHFPSDCSHCTGRYLCKGTGVDAAETPASSQIYFASKSR